MRKMITPLFLKNTKGENLELLRHYLDCEAIVSEGFYYIVGKDKKIMRNFNKILLPTDFSENARQALNYALQFLSPEGGEIMLVYAYKVYSTSGMFISVEKLMKEDAERDMDLLLRHYQERLPDNISLDHRIIRGEPVDTIVQLAEQGDFDLILMGTTGATGLDEVFMGSTTGGVIKRTDVPLLAIPKDYKYKSFTHLILTADGDDYSSSDVLKPFVKLARATEARIEVLCVSPKGERTLKHIDEHLNGLSFDIVKKKEGDLVEAIEEEVEKEGSQLVGMVKRSRGFLSGLFHSSATLKTAFSSPVPLLVMFD